MTTTRHIAIPELAPTKLSYTSGQPLLPDTSRVGYLGRLSTAWSFLVNYVAPLGYEDERGFHYGEPPRKNVQPG
jgi:hypothetical protein